MYISEQIQEVIEMKGKTALITGGTGGIGTSLCKRLTCDGYLVIAGYASSDNKAEKLKSAGFCADAVKFDVADREQVNDAIKLITEKYGAPSLLVNNAGISEIDLFTAVSGEISDRIADVNLKGTMNCSRIVLPDMIRKKAGSIINISSMWGQVGASCEVDYSASKAGIIGFTKALAKEVAPSGIRVNCVSPGFIMTEMNARFTTEELNAIREELPLGCFGAPDHVASAVSFLASEESAYITGQVLAVNGGMVI